jgi:UDP-glucose 4-epimerase
LATVLVTGGAGFIGSHLVRELIALGHAVRVLDNFSSGHRENLAGLALEIIEGDIRDQDLVRRAMEGVELVFHLAAMVSVPQSMAQPLDCYAVNLSGSLNVLWQARAAGARRVILASSCAVYGEAEDPLVEEAPTAPLSPYADSKLAMERAAQLFTRAFGLPTVSLRYFNVYGPRQAPDSDYAAVIPRFITRMLEGQPPLIHGDGLQTRNFVYVEDVVRANLLAAKTPQAVGGVFNVGGQRSVSVLELAETLQRLIPSAPRWEHGPARPGDIRHSAADLEAAARALGYRPQIDLEQGLQRTVEWFEASRAPKMP